MWLVWAVPFVPLGGDLGNEYFDHLAEMLYAAVISDVLDSMGYRDQALDAHIVHSAALEKVGKEDRVRGELAAGSSLAEAWARTEYCD